MTVPSMPMWSAWVASMPAPATGHAPPEVAAADDDGDVDAEVLADVDDLRGAMRSSTTVAVEAVAGSSPAKASPDELEDDPVPPSPGPPASLPMLGSRIDGLSRSRPGRSARWWRRR